MKGAIAVVLVIVVLSSFLYFIPSQTRPSIKYLLNLFDKMGDLEVPSLTGGHDFSSFGEGLASTAYIMTIPIRWAFFVIKFCTVFVGGLFGNMGVFE